MSSARSSDAVGFDHVGVFTYSHEEGTAAEALDDDVPARVKRQRRDRLMRQQKRIVRAAQKRRIGERVRLVVDGVSEEHELVLRGRLAGQAPEIDPRCYLTDCDPQPIAPRDVCGRRRSSALATTTCSSVRCCDPARVLA